MYDIALFFFLFLLLYDTTFLSRLVFDASTCTIILVLNLRKCPLSTGAKPMHIILHPFWISDYSSGSRPEQSSDCIPQPPPVVAAPVTPPPVAAPPADPTTSLPPEELSAPKISIISTVQQAFRDPPALVKFLVNVTGSPPPEVVWLHNGNDVVGGERSVGAM